MESLIQVTGTITDSFKKLRFVTIACLAIVFLTSVTCVVVSVSKISEFTHQVYVLDRGQAFSASREDVTVNRADEVDAVSRRFHSLFFNVSPNREVVNYNLEQAYQLCADNTVYSYYNDVQASGFYTRMSQAQAVQDIKVDSIRINTMVYPYYVETFSSLYVTRPTLIVKSRLVTTCNMIDVPRDKSNMNGLKIENFQVPVLEEVQRVKRTQ